MSEAPPVRRLADWSGTDLRTIVENHDSPAYLLNLDRVGANYDRLAAAFPDAEIRYAAKANAGRAVLERLVEKGAGVECASAGEVHRALEAGFAPRDLHYTAVNPPARDLKTVLEVAEESPELTITAGARDTIDRLEALGYDGRLCVRIHPGVGAGHGESVATGADAKFGVPAETAPEIMADAANRGFDVVGVHAHAGSGFGNDDLEAHGAVVEAVADVARRSDLGLEFVDVGGGFGVPYHPDEQPLDIGRVAETTRSVLSGIDATLAIEPGRYLVADAGVLLTAVNTVKPAGQEILAGTDAGMTTLLRPALYGAYHHVRNLAPNADQRPTETVSVVGPVCESTDIIAESRQLPRPERGDVLAIGTAGAYGIEMAFQYNSRPRPPVIARSDGDTAVVRRRETIDDITVTEVQ